MNLRIVLPEQELIETEVDKVTAEAPNGSFTMLEHHIDFVTSLVPGILSFVQAGADEKEVFIAVNGGTLVKRAGQVNVSTRSAVQGPGLEELQEAVQRQFVKLDERERKARSALSRMEADFARRFLELGQYGR